MNKKYAELLDSINNNHKHIDESVLIIDGLNTFLRNFSIINHINRTGEPIGGLTGTLKSIGYATRIINPTKLIIVFDGVGGSSSKRNLYPEYKANRNKSRITNYNLFSSKEEEEESINNQMGRLIHYLKCLPISLICIDSIEADDVIGYIANQYESNIDVKNVNIMSADKDFLQLVSKKISVYSPSKKKIYTPNEVLEEYNIPSYNYIWSKILMGDKSDNVPGILGLGPKKLLKLFPNISSSKINSLDEIIDTAKENIDKHQLYSDIIGMKKQLLINNQLMNLREIPLSIANIEIINQSLINKYSFEPYTFNQMYYNDMLGDSIPNVNGWLQQSFGSLL